MNKFGILRYVCILTGLIVWSSKITWAQDTDIQPVDSIVYYIDSLINAQQEIIRIKQEEKYEKRIKSNKTSTNTESTQIDLTYEYRIAKLDKNTPIQLDYNEQVRRYIEIYTGKRAEEYGKMLGLSQYYFPLFEEQLSKYGLPLEFKYLPIIESSLNPLAVSSSGATGLWQFKLTSCPMFDLEVTSYIDDRCDPYKSTIAACKYLQYLYRTFNDWQLVLAAYNGGPGEVRNAIARSGGETGFWKIQSFLPEQTQNYVPAFIAAIYVMNYAPEHDINLVAAPYSYPETDTVQIRQAISFEQIADFITIPMDALTYLNPAYRLGYIPESDTPQTITIPSQYMVRYLEAEPQIQSIPFAVQNGKNRILVSSNNVIKTQDSIKVIHIVQKGEYVHKIAIKYGCTIDDIKTWNTLTDLAVNPGKLLEIYIKPGNDLLLKNSDMVSESNSNGTITGNYMYYIVQQGDTIYGIAQKLGLSTASQIIEMNHIDNANEIAPGRFLKVGKI